MFHFYIPNGLRKHFNLWNIWKYWRWAETVKGQVMNKNLFFQTIFRKIYSKKVEKMREIEQDQRSLTFVFA